MPEGQPGVLETVARVAAALFLLLVTHYGLRYVERRLRSLRRYRPETVAQYVSYLKLIAYVLVAIAAITIVSRAFYAVYIVVVILLGLIVAFSDALRNWGAGLYLRLSESVRVGDEVEVGGLEGTIVEVSNLGVTLLSSRREKVFIPNVFLVNNPIVNRSTGFPLARRVRVLVPLERDEIGLLGVIHAAAMAVREELTSDPLVVKEGVRGGEAVYAIEVEVLNPRKMSYVVSRIAAAVRESLGEQVKVEA